MKYIKKFFNIVIVTPFDRDSLKTKRMQHICAYAFIFHISPISFFVIIQNDAICRLVK